MLTINDHMAMASDYHCQYAYYRRIKVDKKGTSKILANHYANLAASHYAKAMKLRGVK